jgi:hypothetical protein
MFLSATHDNVPPKGKSPKDAEWTLWYSDIAMISGFLSKAEVLIEKGVSFEYYDAKHKNDFECYRKDIKESIERMAKLLETELGIQRINLHS